MNPVFIMHSGSLKGRRGIMEQEKLNRVRNGKPEYIREFGEG